MYRKFEFTEAGGRAPRSAASGVPITARHGPQTLIDSFGHGFP
jgi:hypothetical protein